MPGQRHTAVVRRAATDHACPIEGDGSYMAGMGEPGIAPAVSSDRQVARIEQVGWPAAVAERAVVGTCLE